MAEHEQVVFDVLADLPDRGVLHDRLERCQHVFKADLLRRPQVGMAERKIICLMGFTENEMPTSSACMGSSDVVSVSKQNSCR